MLSFPTPSVYQTPNCFVTHGSMAHVESGQTPSKGKPWSSIMSQGFNHKAQLIVPAECCQTLEQKLSAFQTPPTYSKVVMSLGDILSGSFFTEYIKKGDILMLSEGKTTSDNVYSLREGLLTMYMDKETYERAGLVGKPHGVKGKRGLKPRWVVSYQLRDPSMLHGKKGFDRLEYACKHVLNQPVTWLFCNVSSTKPSPDPLDHYAPIRFTAGHGLCTPQSTMVPSLAVPSDLVANGDKAGFEQHAAETYEWLSLVRLGSPRITSGDSIDPYLSRYQVPSDPGAEPSENKLCTVSWQGFLTADWVRRLLVDVLAILPSRTWFALSVTSFAKGSVGDSTEITFLRPPDAMNHYIVWEIKGQET